MLSFLVPVPHSSAFFPRIRSLFCLCGRARQLTVESTKLKAVEDVPLLPLVGSFFEGKDFPTGDAAKMVKNSGQRCRRGF